MEKNYFIHYLKFMSMLITEEQDLDILDDSDKGTVILVSVAGVCFVPKSIF